MTRKIDPRRQARYRVRLTTGAGESREDRADRVHAHGERVAREQADLAELRRRKAAA